MFTNATKTTKNVSPFRVGAKATSQSFCGPSTQISDATATIIHHTEYMPYGETFLELKYQSPTPYKFNGKEKDEETGMYYYGARYYTPEVSVWLSVDPLADKYPSMSPFMYCAGNPLKYVDPDGMRLDKYYDSDGNLLLDTKKGNSEYVVKTYKTKLELTRLVNANIDDLADVDNITESEYNNTVKSIENVAKGLEKLESINRNNLVELPSQQIREEFKQTCFDNGMGGTQPWNNMEYYATIANNYSLTNKGFTKVKDPSKGGSIEFSIFSRKPTIHSHPSGTNNTFYFIQFPTKLDQQGVGNSINVMVPMGKSGGSKYYYLFNNKGIQAIFPRDRF